MPKRIGTTTLLIAAFACTAVCAACSEDDDQAPQLSSSHTGWNRADCADCHLISLEHDGTHEVYECLGCHGNNGQPSRPPGHADLGCNACHNSNGSAPWNETTHSTYDAIFVPHGCIGCHG